MKATKSEAKLLRFYKAYVAGSALIGRYRAVSFGDMFGCCTGVDLGQQLLRPPQDPHLQWLVFFGHQG